MIAKKETGIGTAKFTEERTKRKSMVYFHLGLLTMGSMVLAAFTYESPIEANKKIRLAGSEQINYMVEEKEEIEIPKIKPEVVVQQRTEQTQEQTIDINPEVTDDINPVKNTDREVESEVRLGDLTIQSGDLSIGLTNVTGEIVEIPDVDAKFVGGFAEMQHFISKHLLYPEESVRFGDEGIVHVNFVVEKDGSISNVTIERGVSKELDREAKRIVRSFPKWIPGESQAEKVRTRVILPIRFQLH